MELVQSEAAPPLSPGTGSSTVGSYRVLQCTQKSQLSEVYQASHLETGTTVALKRIKIFDMHPSMRKECETEINLLQALDHPHLIKYLEHFNHGSDLYVVMELAAGGTLAQKAESARQRRSSGGAQRVDETPLWRWLCDTASALAYLHRRRILHRDVKPSHIFLGESGQAKLGDFGLSKAMSTKTQCAFSCVGTPFYMSPEIVKGEGYSFSSDVWSLGCAIYQVAIGYPPFFRQDMDFYALGDAICSARYPAMPPEDWSKDFISLMGRILIVDPGQRIDAQGILDVAGRKLVCIQDFEILGSIGRGKFSEVHRSLWRKGGDQEVALKRVQIFEMDTEARRECNAEVNMLKLLEHPTIIRYLDSFIEGSELVIVLELAPHGDLANLLLQLKQASRSLAEPQIWAIFLQVIDALCYMHEKRIMHRDIKPANIFMANLGVVKLGDLGLGRYFSSNTYRAHSVVGTPFYMSPEVITNSDGYSFKSDIWSLGCVLYELQALSSPFESSCLNYYALGNQIRTGEYKPLPEGSSHRVRALISDMLQVQRDARPDASAVLEAAARQFAETAGGQEVCSAAQGESEQAGPPVASCFRAAGGPGPSWKPPFALPAGALRETLLQLVKAAFPAAPGRGVARGLSSSSAASDVLAGRPLSARGGAKVGGEAALVTLGVGVGTSSSSGASGLGGRGETAGGGFNPGGYHSLDSRPMRRGASRELHPLAAAGGSSSAAPVPRRGGASPPLLPATPRELPPPPSGVSPGQQPAPLAPLGQSQQGPSRARPEHRRHGMPSGSLSARGSSRDRAAALYGAQRRANTPPPPGRGHGLSSLGHGGSSVISPLRLAGGTTSSDGWRPNGPLPPLHRVRAGSDREVLECLTERGGRSSATELPLSGLSEKGRGGR
ncbi:unnamed protein product [Polarella glacialis]|uniref:non-specific serine/threonine protein kinase n=1 Tax=Polarella glacialis TaxID=89957 RepID=A0A813LXW5_POLGL|nr:unnamed protein product [Polarella glacialis]